MSRPAAAPQDFAHLLLRVARGADQAAFVELFEYFAPRLKRLLHARGFAAQVAEELAQETMLAVWRKAALFDPEKASAATWIFAVGRHRAVDYARRDKVAAASARIELETADPLFTEDAFSQAEEEARIRAGLTELPEEQQQVVRLAYFHDKSHSEIAGELGLPLGTVKSRLRLALERLRGLMGRV